MNMVEGGTEMVKQLQKLCVGETVLVKHERDGEYALMVHVGKGTLNSLDIQYRYELYETPGGLELRGLLVVLNADLKLEVGTEVFVSGGGVAARLVVQGALGNNNYIAKSVGEVTDEELKTAECWDA